MRSEITNRAIAAITVLIVALVAAESFVRALFVAGTRDRTNRYTHISKYYKLYILFISENMYKVVGFRIVIRSLGMYYVYVIVSRPIKTI